MSGFSSQSSTVWRRYYLDPVSDWLVAFYPPKVALELTLLNTILDKSDFFLHAVRNSFVELTATRFDGGPLVF